jgi:predicted amidohydrolase YtcJ
VNDETPGGTLTLVNGTVWGAPHDSIAVESGRIVAVGAAEDLLAARAPDARVVDLRGACVVPGFTDSHTHFHRTALLSEHFLDFTALAPSTIGDVLEAVRRRSAHGHQGEWVQGDNLSDFVLAERRFPTRWELDAVSDGRPVLLRGMGKHVVAANSLALARAGITAETPDPAGGRIERDDQGEPTGVLHERAKLRLDTTRVDTVVPPLAEEDRLRALQAGIAQLHSQGICSIHEITRTADEFGDYQRLREAGGLTMRVRAYVRVIEGQATVHDLARLGVRSGLGDSWLRLGGVKVSIDGSCAFRNAALYEDYPGHPGNRGLVRVEQDELDETVSIAHRLGLQVAVHAIGPRAVDMALAAFEAAGSPQALAAMRHRVEHAYLPARPEQLARMRNLGLVLSTQPGFIQSVGDTWVDIFGPEYAGRMMPLRSAVAAGVLVMGNSDCPTASTAPLSGIAAAVRRRTRLGVQLGTDEAVTIAEAIRMYTTVPAYSAREERQRGSVEVGKRADLTVLSADPGMVPADELGTVSVVGTLVDGVPVFDRME